MDEPLPSLARELAMPYYDDALPAHDAFHANRVRRLGGKLAAAYDEPVDREILAAAAWLHDIGRPRERRGRIDNHGEWAAAEVTELLAEHDGDVPVETVEAIQHCLRSHSIRPSSPEPQTPEAELLFDADKLQAAGAIGIVRLACIIGERSGRAGDRYATIDTEVRSDLGRDGDPDLTILYEWAAERLDALHTPPAQREARFRWRFMTRFFEYFEQETRIDERYLAERVFHGEN
ncbi:HD domain-containing protein [Halobaculum sp. EA56]|uniref:HD domain-containing protein n=1 Tax=Halobaculum sp. EA56 TaxID=3421648 RepID=UPI003EB9B3C0